MKRKDPLGPVSHLIGEPGFPSKEALGSFCLAVGLFHDRKADPGKGPPRNWDPTKYDAWPMIELIAYRAGAAADDRSRMKELLYAHLLAGVEMVEKTVGKRSGLSALKELSRFVPP